MNLEDNRVDLDGAKQCASDVFSDTYLEARQKFLVAAAGSKPYACSTPGPSGEALFTDVAYFGRTDAKRLLVLISGTHGVEGYCGSAAQLAFMQAQFNVGLPSSTAVLLVHALNCYSFAWDRRVTAEGCDLNRNFVDFSSPLPANPEYEELAEYLIPAERTEQAIQNAQTVLAAYRKLHGQTKFVSARTRGQYTRPGGLFYGGTMPAEARQTLEKIVEDYSVGDREEVVIIDYHTGLGPYGYGELQCEQSSGANGYERAKRMFGPSATSPDLGTSSSVVIHGSQDEYWQRLLGDRHTYVAFEFGTYTLPPERSTLVDDHWLFMYRREEANSQLGRRIRSATKHHFYPQKHDWMEMVISRAHLVHRQAIEALTSQA
jgi:hypothetical protein